MGRVCGFYTDSKGRRRPITKRVRLHQSSGHEYMSFKSRAAFDGKSEADFRKMPPPDVIWIGGKAYAYYAIDTPPDEVAVSRYAQDSERDWEDAGYEAVVITIGRKNLVYVEAVKRGDSYSLPASNPLEAPSYKPDSAWDAHRDSAGKVIFYDTAQSASKAADTLRSSGYEVHRTYNQTLAEWNLEKRKRRGS